MTKDESTLLSPDAWFADPRIRRSLHSNGFRTWSSGSGFPVMRLSLLSLSVRGALTDRLGLVRHFYSQLRAEEQHSRTSRSLNSIGITQEIDGLIDRPGAEQNLSMACRKSACTAASALALLLETKKCIALRASSMN